VLAASQPGASDPIVAWYRDVRMPVVAAHYSSVRRDAFVNRLERIVVPANVLVSIITSSESGEEIRTLSDLMQRQEEARVAHPWERMYVLQLARFVTRVLGELGGRAQGRGFPVPYLEEFFYGFQLEDRESDAERYGRSNRSLARQLPTLIRTTQGRQSDRATRGARTTEAIVRSRTAWTPVTGELRTSR
jgi:hypothetical protein